MCEAKNGISPGLSKVIQLKINGKFFCQYAYRCRNYATEMFNNVLFTAPVKFIQKINQIRVQLNDDANIQCTAAGDKPIKITWKGSTNVLISKDVDRR